LIGSSSAFQPFIGYEETIQNYLLKHSPELKYCEAIGFPGAEGEVYSLIKTIEKINNCEINENDIVVFIANEKLGINLSKELDFSIYNVPLNTKNDFYDRTHFSNEGGNKISKKILKILSEKNNNSESEIAYKGDVELLIKDAQDKLLVKSKKIDESFSYFKKYISKYIDPQAGRCASILVNCNPITLGHQHLIDTACRAVDRLFLFVIETELNDYSFKERFEMVQRNYESNKKITVLKGGLFMCTEHIIPEYFNKEGFVDVDNQELEGLKLESFYFGKKIAPILGITEIWLGHEPNCKLTKKYNDFMSMAMPFYGVRVNIIDRINSEGEPISASRVRELMKTGDFDSVKKIVSNVTYDYLLNIHLNP